MKRFHLYKTKNGRCFYVLQMLNKQDNTTDVEMDMLVVIPEFP